jgi:hypothetical protein
MRPLVLALLAGFAATPALAQDGYMIGMPRATVSLHLGAAGPAANDDIFRFFTDQLTLERGDFRGLAWGVDLAFRVLPQIDVLGSFATSSSSSSSEFRDFVETNDEPIRQTTGLSRSALTGGVKVHLLSRGRSLGRYAFIPNRVSPYVGATAGALWYDLDQRGDFVDFETLDIFSDYFVSDGTTFTANVIAGSDIWLLQRVGLNIETRYNWAKADLQDSFADFEQIDLRGWQLTAGLSFRY